jgi:hypothetical protein
VVPLDLHQAEVCRGLEQRPVEAECFGDSGDEVLAELFAAAFLFGVG